jgi:Raf kinase inhibitor-like YbhB/YbcL family protein
MLKKYALILLLMMILAIISTSCGTSENNHGIALDSSLPHTLLLTSPAFENNSTVPIKYTCSGDDVSPPLSWTIGPQNTKSFALICEDPDAPGGTFVHWIIFNIQESSRGLNENILNEPTLNTGAFQGKNGFGTVGYAGPCPPLGNSPHHYVFTLYALDTVLDITAGATKDQFIHAIDGYVLDQDSLIGLYGR